MSEDLKGFFRSYLAWVRAGAEQGKPFDGLVGLCHNLVLYCNRNETYYSWHEMNQEMKALFELEGLDLEYPFNENFSEYNDETECFRNPARIAFVRKYAGIMN